MQGNVAYIRLKVPGPFPEPYTSRSYVHYTDLPFLKGSPDIAVKLLPYDHEVMCLNPGNNLLQKCRERLCT
jgi:hypothetical protein